MTRHLNSELAFKHRSRAIYKLNTQFFTRILNKNLKIWPNYGKIMRCALFEILYLTEVYLVTD